MAAASPSSLLSAHH